MLLQDENFHISLSPVHSDHVHEIGISKLKRPQLLCTKIDILTLNK